MTREEWDAKAAKNDTLTKAQLSAWAGVFPEYVGSDNASEETKRAAWLQRVAELAA
jgi:hypothetical protein